MILLSIALLPYRMDVSFVLWSVGAALHLVFTLYVLSVWIHHTHFEIAHINPAWFIPIVGNILLPIAGVRHASPEIAWFFFSIGLLFWLVLLTRAFAASSSPASCCSGWRWRRPFMSCWRSSTARGWQGSACW